MKNKLFILLIVASSLAACKQDNIKLSSLTSLNVTNAVVNGATLTLNTSANTVGNNGYGQFALLAGQTKVDLFDDNELSYAYYQNIIATVNSSYYSLYLTGTDSAHVQSVLVKENYQNYTDSVAGVRFIDLSPGSNPVSVDIQGNANGSEVGNMAYLSYTTFKKYSATAANSTYNFEFRDAATGTLIASYSLTTPTFKNVTLALAGLESNATIIQINEY